METRNCQNCKQDFTILPDDFSFYEKIKVPPPTFCPECRLIRRLQSRNERVLFKTECALCKNPTITGYHPDNAYIIYCSNCYNSDKWDPLSYGVEYDFSKTFFEQYSELQKKVPHKGLYEIMSQNSAFSNYVFSSKDIYLSFTVVDSEWIYYTRSADRCKESMDCYNILDCESCYGCIQTSKSYGSSYLIESKDCVSSHFLFDCVNCTDCFMSSNLRNKQYYFRNEQLSKDEYKKMIESVHMSTISSASLLRNELKTLVLNSIHRFSTIIGSVDCTGDNIIRSKNTKDSFHSTETENSRFAMRTVGMKDSYDVVGSLQSELLYEVHGGARGSMNSHFVNIGTATIDSEYTDHCINVKNVFGSVSLNQQSYCILNKQYTKEEYTLLVQRVKNHMNDMPYIDANGRVYSFGEYFPQICSPFAYNESAAQEFFPLTKEEIIKKGYLYREAQVSDYTPTITPTTLPDDIKDITTQITDEIIECEHNRVCIKHRCVGAFKINSEELLFYKKFNLPLPNLCPNCRHYERLEYVHMPILYKRKCNCSVQKHIHTNDRCDVEFETSYSLDRPEKVYCEKCYQQEVL